MNEVIVEGMPRSIENRPEQLQRAVNICQAFIQFKLDAKGRRTRDFFSVVEHINREVGHDAAIDKQDLAR
ncbi:hypothetical protein D3C71_1995080 [compost metagenome]